MKRKLAFLITFVVLLSLAVVTVSAKDYANVTTGEGVIMSIDTESFYTYPFHTGKTAQVHAGFVTSDDYSLGSPRHGTDGNTLWVYCLEFQVEGHTAALRYAAPPSSSTNHVWASLSDEQKLGITLATLYGYPMSGGNADDYFAATQCIIWEYQTGIRTSTKTNSRQAVNYTYSDGGTYSMYLDANYFANIMAQRASGTAAYNDLVTKIYNHFKQPSFAGTKIELAYNAATGGYSKTLTDTNGVLSSYDVTCDSGVSVSVSGNNLTLTSSKYVNGANLKLTKKTLPTTSQAMMILDPVSGQSMVTGQMNVPVSYSYKVYAQITGDLKVLKVDAGTGKGIPGAQFEVYDMSDNLIDTETSDESGVATFKKLKYGTYYAIESLAPTGYIRSEEKYIFSITQEGQVVSWECKDENLMRFFSVYKKGEVLTGFEESDGCFTPVYEEQYLAGAKVGIYAGEDIYTADGTRRYEKDELIETLETLSSGPVLTSELFEGVYYAKELSAPAGYVLGDAEPVEVCLFSDDLSVGFSNSRQKCELKFVKCFDDGSKDFSAVTFGVFTASPILDLPADSLLEIMQVDSSGKCTMTCDLPCGYDYYVKELTTASGYAMSTADMSFTFSPMSDDEEVFSVTFDPVVNYKMIVGGAASVASPDTGDDNGDAIRFYIITAVEALCLIVLLVVRKNKLTLYY